MPEALHATSVELPEPDGPPHPAPGPQSPRLGRINISLESACRQLLDVGYLPSEEEAAAWTQDSSNPVQDQGRRPRPTNKFMIYQHVFRRELQRIVFRDDAGVQGLLNLGLQSKLIGFHWKKMSKEDQQPWEDAAVRVKREHAEKYPGYKYPCWKRGEGKKGMGKKGVNRVVGAGRVGKAAAKRRQKMLAVASSRGGSVSTTWDASTLGDDDESLDSANHIALGDDVDRDVTSEFSPAPTTPQVQFKFLYRLPPGARDQYSPINTSLRDDREVSQRPVTTNNWPKARRATVHLPLDVDTRPLRDPSPPSQTLVDHYNRGYNPHQLRNSKQGQDEDMESTYVTSIDEQTVVGTDVGNFTDSLNEDEEREGATSDGASSTSTVGSHRPVFLPQDERMSVNYLLTSPKAPALSLAFLRGQHSPRVSRYAVGTSMPRYRHEAEDIDSNMTVTTIPESFVRTNYDIHGRKPAYHDEAPGGPPHNTVVDVDNPGRYHHGLHDDHARLIRPRARTLIATPSSGLLDTMLAGPVPPPLRWRYRFGLDSGYASGDMGVQHERR